MKKNKMMGVLPVVLLLLLFLWPEDRAEAAGDWTEIDSAEDLCAMQAEGSYRLTADINMEGVEWTPPEFHGSFDGNGFAILNLHVNECGTSVRSTYDGNMIEYETSFAGMFSVLQDAEVKNLQLINLRIEVETDKPCFVGGIAGYMEGGSIEESSVQGILQLKAHEKMFGVGGVIGYGCGSIDNTAAEVTLVCTDTDAATKDEQFMGGICAAGYPDVNNCEVQIAGFDSDHGYVHNGGLIGMYIFYPKGISYYGKITNNHVTGKIRFFEDNTNRRAYCKGFIGEIMIWEFENAGNDTEEFERDEVFSYDKDIMPHECSLPSMVESIVETPCGFGYTLYTCENCGYTEKDHFTLRQHDYEWTVEKEATVEADGLRHGVCRQCGAECEEVIPRLEVPEGVTLLEPETEESAVAVVTEVPAEEEEKKSGGGLWLLFVLLVLAAAGGGYYLYLQKTRKKRKGRRK